MLKYTDQYSIQTKLLNISFISLSTIDKILKICFSFFNEAAYNNSFILQQKSIFSLSLIGFIHDFKYQILLNPKVILLMWKNKIGSIKQPQINL